MNSYRNTARIVGVLFITGTVAGILSYAFTGPVLNDQDYLTKISTNKNQIILGVLFALIMGFALSLIPVLMFPIFKKYSEALALGAVVFRGALEAVTYIAIAVSWLLLVTLSQEFVNAQPVEISHYQTLGILLKAVVDHLNPILGIVFSLGALIVYYLFYLSKLIPRWLSVWGIIGAVLYLTQGILVTFGIDFGLLLAPLALQEMVLAVWLIIKGFEQTETK